MEERNRAVKAAQAQHSAYKDKWADEDRALAEVQKLSAEIVMLKAENICV